MHENVETKQKLLDVAEKLFSENGISATSIRNIVSEAGTNIASINYHFGSKSGLIKEVFARRIQPVILERSRMLDIIDAQGQPPELEEILKALIEPMIKIHLGNNKHKKLFLKLFSMIHSETDDIKLLILSNFEETNNRILMFMHKALPHLTMVDLMWRFKFIIGAVIMSASNIPDLKHFKDMGMKNPDKEDILQRIMPFLTGGLRAPVHGPDRLEKKDEN